MNPAAVMPQNPAKKYLIAVCGALDAAGVVVPEYCIIRQSDFEDDYEDMLDNIAHWQPGGMKEAPAAPVTPVAFFHAAFSPLPLFLRQRLAPIIARTCFLPLTISADEHYCPTTDYTEELVKEVLSYAEWGSMGSASKVLSLNGTSDYGKPMSAAAETAILVLDNDDDPTHWADDFAYACLLAHFGQTEKDGVLNAGKWDTRPNHPD